MASTWQKTSSDFGSGLPPRPSTAGPGGRTATTDSTGKSVEPELSPWVANAQPEKVHRFLAYFQEPVSQGGGNDTTTGFRIRKVVVTFFPKDGGIGIDEPKTKNSGLPQGRIMKRLVLKNPDTGKVFALPDFSIGESLTINGRPYTIVDADEATRLHFRTELKRPMPPGCVIPDDGYATLRASRSIPKKSGVHAAPARKGEFFNKDLIVLCFKAAYQDDKLYGERRDYKLHYYVLNDTVEITEVAAQGRHNFPNLLRRQKLPKDSFYVPNGIGGAMDKGDDNGQRDNTIQYVTWRDLACGKTLNIYGRKVLLVSCDSTTVNWYAKQGINQKPLKLSVDDFEEPAGPKVPPYNGYGSEDDLYAMGMSLEPAVIDRKLEDFARFMRAKGKVLRFIAKLVDAKGQDASREFVINYFLATDQVSVFEPPIRNSGIVGGLFLAKGRYKKYLQADGFDGEVQPIGGGRGGRGGALSRWLRPTDFYLNAEVQFEMPSTGSKLFALKVMGYDDYTKKIMQDDKSEFPQTPADLDVTRLSEKMVATKLPIRTIFQEVDRFGSGFVSPDVFKETVRSIEREASASGISKVYDIPDSELEYLCYEYGVETDEGLLVSYNDFVDMLVLSAPRTAREYERDRQGTFAFSVEERMLKVLRSAFEGAGLSRLRSSFREEDPAHVGAITAHAYKDVLRKHKFHVIMTERAADALRMQYDTNADGTLNYNAICVAIHPGDFDKYVEAYIGPTKEGEMPTVGGPKNPLATTVKGLGEGLTTEEYLKKMNDENFSYNGDLARQLTRAFNSFSSCFARHNRKKQIRKHMTAFDIFHCGMVTREQFLSAIDDVVAEFFIDFDERDKELIVHYMFPNEEVKVNYEKLLTVICTRDVKKAGQLREDSMSTHVDTDKQFLVVDEQRARDFGGTLNLFSGK